MLWSWLRRHPHVVDGVLVLVLAAGYVGRQAHQAHWQDGVPIAVLEVVPLLWLRSRPLAVLAVVTAATLTDAALYRSVFPVPVGVAVYAVAVHHRRETSLAAGAAAAVALGGLALARDGYHQLITTLLALGIAWVIGDNLGTRRAYLHALEERAERLERERETEAARAVAEEQARIARELHDVVAHSVGVMVVQAAAARDVFAARPDRAREALAAIEATGRDALGELRRLLGSVRGDEEADYAPQPGLDRLGELLERVRAAGLDVSLEVQGDPRPLARALELSAYRIVQEALTNTLKHAAATRVEVGVRYGADALELAVRDDGGGGADGDGTGSGLIGMRERVAAFGGSLSAGPRPAGGFAVEARLPL